MTTVAWPGVPEPLLLESGPELLEGLEEVAGLSSPSVVELVEVVVAAGTTAEVGAMDCCEAAGGGALSFNDGGPVHDECGHRGNGVETVVRAWKPRTRKT